MTSRLKKFSGDTLFYIQLGFAAFFCGSELFHILFSSLEGISVTMFVSVQIFLGINLGLAHKAHKLQPTRITWQTRFTYAWWFVWWGACLAVISRRMLQNFSDIWSTSEYFTIGFVLVGLFVVFLYARKNDLAFNDPMVRGYNALVFKAFPQLGQAWKFLMFGGMSWSGWAILAGHITILTRLGQLFLSVREASWDRNRIGSAVSEIGNEISWLIATGVWLWWKFL